MTTAAVVLTLVASNVANIVAKESLGYVPAWLTAAKVAILLAAALYCWRTNSLHMARYSVILGGVIGFSYLFALLGRTAAWQGVIDPSTFVGHHGSIVLLKLLSSIPLVGLMLWLLKSPESAYLVKGDLSVKAEPIRWLGIHANWVSWGLARSCGTCAHRILVKKYTIMITSAQSFNSVPPSAPSRVPKPTRSAVMGFAPRAN